METFLTLLIEYFLISLFIFSFFTINLQNFKVLKGKDEIENKNIKNIAIVVISIFWIFMLPIMIKNTLKENT